ncbi:MAG: 3-phosphoshikimate 1-carboxyvinyltransferase, partial [Clostridia bacterium]|nr:3-phosphoshikimate 1-carboxyvinyltransferase [Clostridia bacterium]
MKIFPREEIYGVFSAPSDRAVTQRAIILGSIAKGKTYVVRPLMCADTTATIGCVRKLGAKVKVKGDIIEIRGAKTVNDETRLDCGNSGLAMRLLCGVVAGSGLNAVVTGDKYLLKRSMKNVKEPLEMMGATVALTNYTVAPIRVEGEKVRPIDYEMQYPSSQVKSAVLLAALTGGVKATVKEPVPTKDHTEILLKEMGADITIDKENSTVTLNKSELYGKRIYISGDFSSAAYLLALGIMLGKVTVKNVGVNPTRIAIIHVLRKMGARIEIRNKRILCGELIADVTAYKSKLTATHVTAYDMSKMSGTLSVLAVLMGLAEGESIIGGEAYPNPEKNARLDYICEAICALGGNCRKINGGIVIRGVEKY